MVRPRMARRGKGAQYPAIEPQSWEYGCDSYRDILAVLILFDQEVCRLSQDLSGFQHGRTNRLQRTAGLRLRWIHTSVASGR